MQNTYTNTINTPIGYIEITTDESCLLSVKFTDISVKEGEAIPLILAESIKQIGEYFSGTRKVFDLEIRPEGSGFQHNIWQLVSKVPFGKTATYLDIAIESGSKNNTRAVGLANGRNPIPIIIPCHRIIGTDGKLTGYAGGLEKKRWLLQHELLHFKPQNLLF